MHVVRRAESSSQYQLEQNNSHSVRGDQEFSKKYRLLSPADFDYLKAETQSFRSKSFIAIFKPCLEKNNNARIGLSVSKKVGKAHRRNRIKRLLREKFRVSGMRKLRADFLIIIHKSFDKNAPDEKAAEELLIKNFEQFEGYLTKRF